MTAEGANRSASGTHPMVILLVEDDGIIREYARLCLEDRGCTVHCTGNGEQALAMLESLENIDLLIADVSLPSMSGLDLAISARHRDPRLRVLFVSGRDMPCPAGVLERTQFLQKPYTPGALTQAAFHMTV